MISGTFVASPYAAAVLLACGAACSNLLLAAAWNTVVDVGGLHSGVVGATMNTAGQVAGFLSPLVTGYIVQYLRQLGRTALHHGVPVSVRRALLARHQPQAGRSRLGRFMTIALSATGTALGIAVARHDPVRRRGHRSRSGRRVGERQQADAE